MKDVRSRGGTDSQRAYARFAGLMYLVVLAFDIGGIVVTGAAGGHGSFAHVSQHIAASETWYRIGLCFALVGSLATILLAIGLYAAVKPVDGTLAMTALLFRAGEAVIGGAGISAGFSVLQIHLAANNPGAFTIGQLTQLAYLTSGASTEVAAIFFSLGSTIFFYLFLKSHYIPRLLAAWGVFASVVYAATWFVSLILPHLSGPAQVIGSLPILIAELTAGFWLLIRGIRLEVRL